MTTKPYISGAGYINKMSDYCSSCSFHPQKNCPITRLYWAYLARHAQRFSSNFRMKMTLASLKKRSAEKKEQDAQIFAHVIAFLSKGLPLHPSTLPQ